MQPELFLNGFGHYLAGRESTKLEPLAGWSSTTLPPKDSMVYNTIFDKGKLVGTKIGIENTMKAVMTTGANQLYVSGDKVIPFDNVDEILQNKDARKTIKNRLYDNRLKDVNTRLSNSLAGDDIETIKQRFKTNNKEIDSIFETKYPTAGKGINQRQGFIADEMNKLAGGFDNSPIKGRPSKDRIAKKEAAIRANNELTDLSALFNEHRKDDSAIKLHRELKGLRENPSVNFSDSAKKVEFNRIKDKDTAILLTDDFNIYDIRGIRRSTKPVIKNIPTVLEKIQFMNTYVPKSGINDLRTIKPPIIGISDYINIPVEKFIPEKPGIISQKSRKLSIK